MHCRHSVLGDSGRQVGGKWDASVKLCSLLHPGRQQCTRRQWETSDKQVGEKCKSCGPEHPERTGRKHMPGDAWPETEAKYSKSYDLGTEPFQRSKNV